MFRGSSNEDGGDPSSGLTGSAITDEVRTLEQQLADMVPVVAPLVLSMLLFLGMAWWFFSFAAAESPAPLIIAVFFGVVALLSLVSRLSSRAEGREHTFELAAWLSLFGSAGFIALGLLFPPSQGLNLGPGEEPGILLRLAAMLSFIAGAVSANAGLGVFLAGIWPRR